MAEITTAGITTARITDDEMHAALRDTRPYTIVVLTKTAAYHAEGAPAIVWEHGRRNFALRAEGRLAIVCPVNDGSPVAGVGIFTGNPDEVRAILADDPAVRAGIFECELHPTRSFPGDALPA